MTGLLIKDLQLLGQQKKVILLMLFLAIFLTFETDSSYVITYLTFVVTFLAIASPSFDEADNGYAFLFTLPIKRKTYVLEKYMFGILIVGVACLIGSPISLIFYMARGQMDRCLEGMLQAWMVFPAELCLIAFAYPVQFKYGVERSRIILAVIYGGIMFLGFIGIRLMVSAEIDIRPVVSWFKGHQIFVEGLAWAGGLLAYGISGLISVAVMNKKEY